VSVSWHCVPANNMINDDEKRGDALKEPVEDVVELVVDIQVHLRHGNLDEAGANLKTRPYFRVLTSPD